MTNAVRDGLTATAPRWTPRTRDQIASHLRFLKKLGVSLEPGAKVLDFGCGRGDAVAALVELGFDAYGVDVRAWWAESAPNPIADRLRLIVPSSGVIAFPDRVFDLCLSDQVLEHVFDYVPVFREIGRVLKPGAVSVHRFPGPNTLVDGHTGLPLPILCHATPYLALWALAGHRSPDQTGLGWRETLASSLQIMGGVNYPTKHRLRADAAKAAVSLEFLESRELTLRDSGAAAAIRRQAERYGLGRLAVAAMSLGVQRYMVLRAKP